MASDPSPEMAEGAEPPPPGVRTMAFVRWLLLLGVLLVALGSVWLLLTPPAKTSTRYTCPMVEHAFVIQDEAGDCPICHMTLTPMDASLAEARKSGAGADQVASDVPGLVPIALHLDRVQKIGVRTAVVAETEGSGGLRAPVSVSVPEQGESQLHVRAPGFVERIAVGETGVSVRAGQPMLYVYSPEIYRAEEELLLARRFADSASPGMGPTAEAGRKRLLLLGLSAHDIDDILLKNAPERLTAVRAPAAGYVVKKQVALGAYVTPEMTLFEIVDLSRVYVVAEIRTSDLPLLKVGSKGTIRLGGEREREGIIDLVYPEVTTSARTGRVRLKLPTKQRDLRPGQIGEVVFDTPARRALSIPRDALIDTGTSRYVFLDHGDGHFVPKAVTVGADLGDKLLVTEGLSPGDRVVSGALFLLDSESRLQAALTGVPSAPPASSAERKP